MIAAVKWLFWSAFITISLCKPDPTAAVPITEPSTTWKVNEAGVIHRNGTEFFPFGVYHVSWQQNTQGLDPWVKRDRDLEIIAKMGLNVMHTSLRWEDLPFLDRAAELGVHIGTSLTSAASMTRFGSHPAIAYLQMFDDIDQRDPATGELRYSEADVLERELSINTYAPGKFTYSSAGNTAKTDSAPKNDDRFAAFVGLGDSLAMQLYTYRWRPLRNVFDSLQKLAALAHPTGQAAIANLQTFPHPHLTDPIERFPTPDYVRSATYQALIADVDGILYYTFFDRSVDLGLNDNGPQEALRAEIALLAHEMDIVRPFLLKSTYSLISNAEVVAAQWLNKEQGLILIANTDETQSRSLSVKLPATALTTQPLFASAAAQITAGQLTLTLNPGETAAYRLDIPFESTDETTPDRTPVPPKVNQKPIVTLTPIATTIVDIGNDGFENVVVDGSPSYDPDGGSMSSFAWYRIHSDKSWELLQLTADPRTTLNLPTALPVTLLLAASDDEHTNQTPSYGLSPQVTLTFVPEDIALPDSQATPAIEPKEDGKVIRACKKFKRSRRRKKCVRSVRHRDRRGRQRPMASATSLGSRPKHCSHKAGSLQQHQVKEC